MKVSRLANRHHEYLMQSYAAKVVHRKPKGKERRCLLALKIFPRNFPHTRQIFTRGKVDLIHQNWRIYRRQSTHYRGNSVTDNIQTPDGHQRCRFSSMKTFPLWPYLIFHLHSKFSTTERNTSTYDRIHRQKRPRTKRFELKMKNPLGFRWGRTGKPKCAWADPNAECVEIRFGGRSLLCARYCGVLVQRKEKL